MGNIIAGRNMVLEISISGTYIPIGCAYSCQFEIENEIIGKTDVNAGVFKKKRVRLSDCRANVQGLTTLENGSTISVMYLLQESVRRVEQDLRFRFVDEAGLPWQIQGIFLISNVTVSGESTSFSQFDVSFEGTGGFSQSTPTDESGSSGISLLPGEVTFDWWETTPGGNTISGTGHFGRSFAGETVIEVDREGTGLFEVTGTPGSGQYEYDGITITTDPNNVYNEGERIYVLWQVSES